jgi:hypothetical protein
MTTSISTSVRKLGFWSAILSTIFSIAYIVAQVAEWLGLLGSMGGPHNLSTPFGLVLLLTPSLLLAVSFVVLMVSIHYHASEDKKIWSHVGLTFATIYAVLISIVYYVQLTLVVPHLLRGDVENIGLLIFVPFDSFLYAIDVLGYSFMSLATLFVAIVFTGGKLERFTRWMLIANGLLVPFLALQMYYPPLIYVASLWAITFPCSTASLAILFKRMAPG